MEYLEYLLVAIIAGVIIWVLRRFGARSGSSNDLDE
jgi:hypothetical protein